MSYALIHDTCSLDAARIRGRKPVLATSCCQQWVLVDKLLGKEVETKLRSRLTLENVSVKLGFLRPRNSNIIIQETTASRSLRFLARRMADWGLLPWSYPVIHANNGETLFRQHM
jgi:hypothetical protein